MSGSIKNPEQEAEQPAPMPRGNTKHRTGSGQNTQGNDRGDREQDPEGQQGATHGGSKK